MSKKKDKKNVTVWLDKSAIAKIDALATGVTRSRNFYLARIIEGLVKLPKWRLRKVLEMLECFSLVGKDKSK